MASFLIIRFVQALITLWGLSLAVFLLVRITGSPAELMLPETSSLEDRERLEEAMGLNESLVKQYGKFLVQAIQGDLGRSVRDGRPVVTHLRERFPATIELSIAGIVLVVTLGIPLGILAALKRNSLVDVAIRAWAAVGQAAPNFWVALILMHIISVQLGLLPVAGRGDWRHVILPAFVQSTFTLAGMLRLTRSGLLEVLRQDYVVVARAKGLPERIVLLRHAFRNSLIPLVTFSGLMLVTTFLNGSVVVETIFMWPGIGLLAYESVIFRDYPNLQGTVLAFGAMFVLANFLVDLSYGYLDPRIRVRS